MDTEKSMWFCGVMQHAQRPLYWDTIHAPALAKLSGEFARYTREAFGDFTAFQDLVWWGYVKERREPITRNGVSCGERIFLAVA